MFKLFSSDSEIRFFCRNLILAKLVLKISNDECLCSKNERVKLFRLIFERKVNDLALDGRLAKSAFATLIGDSKNC